MPGLHVRAAGGTILTDRTAQKQAHLDAIRAKADENLQALQQAAAAARERIESGVDDLRAAVDDEVNARASDDDKPTVMVQLPDDFSYADFDLESATPQFDGDSAADLTTGIDDIGLNGEGVVSFDDIETPSDVLTDDAGIPPWEEPE
ncbi:MAG: hypothetical protein JOZ38_11650 [Candidatus Eremiobacteraeota bacterium]|nr:hypothetical protein [Candidatus Eremiobacteraeota bacterium]